MLGPNITGFSGGGGELKRANFWGGAFYGQSGVSGREAGAYAIPITSEGRLVGTLDASRMSNIYGGSESVHPSSTRVLPCIKF